MDSLRRATARRTLKVTCAGGLKAKGKRHLARDITVKRIMGEGSFGQVFEVRHPHTYILSLKNFFKGVISTVSGEERVVLKRTKNQIPVNERFQEKCDFGD